MPSKKKRITEIDNSELSSIIADLIVGIQNKNWLYIDKVINKLCLIRDSIKKN